MNEHLLVAYRESLKAGAMTPAFVELLGKLVRQNYDRRYQSYKILDYDHRIRMEEYAMNMAVKNWDSMILERSTNVYAFFSQKIRGAFLAYLHKLRKQGVSNV